MTRILILHPDLGIGGAERLVVDTALALRENGHTVSFLTNHHDRQHCFHETADGTFDVKIVGDWLPRKLFGRCYALCAYIRMLYAALYVILVLARRQERIDVIFCDQISVCIPILKLRLWRRQSQLKIIYYCHFPDQLLSQEAGYLKRFYRAPLNYLEEISLTWADIILVNSKFTLRIFQDTFRRIAKVPDVLYPSLNTKYFDAINKVEHQHQEKQQENNEINLGVFGRNLSKDNFLFLDINRFERKKNHALAIKAFSKLSKKLNRNDWKRCRLLIAGGYDLRVNENVEHFNELKNLITELNLDDQVTLMPSPKDNEKCLLLSKSQCVVYTPINEHFGIVPLEAMYLSKPVIAMNSGGPTETIVNNSTGFLCEPDIDAVAEAMLRLFLNDTLRERMGTMGHKRVKHKFSFDIFKEKLDTIIKKVMRM